MGGWRDHIRAAKARVHETMRVKAIYYLTPDSEGQIVYVRPRFHLIDTLLAEGVSGMARRNDARISIIFDRTEIAHPRRNAIIQLEREEAYKLGASEAPYMQFIEVEAVRMDTDDAIELWNVRPPEFDDLDRIPVFLSTPTLEFLFGSAGYVYGFSSEWSDEFAHHEPIPEGDPTEADFFGSTVSVDDIQFFARPDAAVSYRWFINDAEVPFADEESLTQLALTPGSEIQVHVIAENSVGSTSIAVTAQVPEQ